MAGMVLHILHRVVPQSTHWSPGQGLLGILLSTSLRSELVSWKTKTEARLVVAVVIKHRDAMRKTYFP